MIDISDFGKFSKKNGKMVVNAENKTAVVYTRVSSKEQRDNNLSLDFQRKTIEEYAQRSGFVISSYFGGTYESAKTDGRKEFQRMLEYIKNNKGKVSHILVYTLDRFSRTGGGAIKLAEELRDKHGVSVFAVTQPADASSPNGELQQNIHFIFSKYDNQLRKQRAIAGMKEKFEKGIWVTKPPQGYDIVRSNGQRKIVVNEIGKKLKKAFVWKAEGLKNEKIITKLNALGVSMYKQQLTKVLKNPFYCGLMAHGMLDGKVIDGNQEALISKELFFKVNEIHQQNTGYGVPHKKELEELPLKVFIKCSECNQPFTGYVVKAKGIWYYKCRTIGCKCNKNVKQMHQLFMELLNQYTIKEHLIEPLKSEIIDVWNDINKESLELEKSYKIQFAEINKKIDSLEEGFYILKEIGKETFDKFYFRYKKESNDIAEQLGKLTKTVSNPEEVINKAMEISSKLATMWHCGCFSEKEKLQKLVFPDGIVYDRKNGSFRTVRVNSVFALIASLHGGEDQTKKGQTDAKGSLSLSAEREGFEPPDL